MIDKNKQKKDFTGYFLNTINPFIIGALTSAFLILGVMYTFPLELKPVQNKLVELNHGYFDKNNKFFIAPIVPVTPFTKGNQN